MSAFGGRHRESSTIPPPHLPNSIRKDLSYAIEGYRSSRNTRCGGTKLCSTSPPPPYRSPRWAKIDYTWARDPSGESIKGHHVAIFSFPPTSRDTGYLRYRPPSVAHPSVRLSFRPAVCPPSFTRMPSLWRIWSDPYAIRHVEFRVQTI